MKKVKKRKEKTLAYTIGIGFTNFMGVMFVILRTDAYLAPLKYLYENMDLKKEVGEVKSVIAYPSVSMELTSKN